MNIIRPALLLAPAEVSQLKSTDSIDFSQTPARSDDFAQTFRGATEEPRLQTNPNKSNDQQAGGERLPSSGNSGNSGNAAPTHRVAAHLDHHGRGRDDASLHTADADANASVNAKAKVNANANANADADADAKTKAKPAKNAKGATAADNAAVIGAHGEKLSPSPSPSLSPPVPPAQVALPTPLSQQAAGAIKNAAAPQSIAASGSAKQTSVAASPADAADSAMDAPTAEQGAIAVPAPAPVPGATLAVGAQVAALPQDIAAMASETANTDTAAANSTSKPAAGLAEPVTASAATDKAQPRAALLAMAGAHAPPLRGAASTDAASTTGAPADAPNSASQSGDALQPSVQTTAASGNPIPAAANPMALNLGAQAAAAIQGISPPSSASAANPAGNPVGNPAVSGGMPGLAASAARTAPASAMEKLPATSESGAKDAESDSGADSGALPQSTAGGSFGAVQALVNANTTSTTDAVTAPTLAVSQPVESQGFGQGVANQVSVMMDNNLNVAKLQVNPASLGPIEVRIALQAGHAQVWMTSHSAVTRDALQDSSSHLKDMLGQQGFGQVSVDISHRQFQERTPQSFTYERNSAPESSPSTAAVQSASRTAARRSSGKLDAYA